MPARFPSLAPPTVSLALAGALVALLPARLHGGLPPAFELQGAYELAVPTGVESLANNYAFDLGDDRIGVRFVYGNDGALAGSQLVESPLGFNIVVFRMTWALDDAGAQTVHVESGTGRRPDWQFDGTLEPATGDLVGDFEQSDGFLGFVGARSGPLRLRRADQRPRTSDFELRFAPEQSAKGAVRGAALQAPGKTDEVPAVLELFDGFEMSGGRVRGRVKTKKRDSSTSAQLVIRGVQVVEETLPRGGTRKRKLPWKVKLAGPVVDGTFRAVGRIDARGFALRDVPVLLPMDDGPPPPPAPPPPPPKNLVRGAHATLASGEIQLQASGVKSRFFGKPADLTVRFPFADGLSTVHAVPGSFVPPSRRHVIVDVGGRIYSTQNDGADVALEIRELSTQVGDFIVVALSGKVVDDRGKSKSVDVLWEAQIR